MKRIADFFKGVNDWGDRTQHIFTQSFAQMETPKQLLIVIVPFGLGWAFIAYAHVVGPWVDTLLNLGPHDIDSAAKIRWRKIWSSALCGPIIAAAIVKFLYNHFKR